MNIRNKYWAIVGHIHTVMIHKHYVFLAMKDCGYFWGGLTHDLSKFSPTEFNESINYYTGTHSPIDDAKKAQGYSMAWLHHKGRNPHHSSFWVDVTFGVVKPCKMPWKYLVESICDTIGAGKAYMKDGWTNRAPIDWWNSHDKKSFYHDDTRYALEYIYMYISEYGWKKTAIHIKDGSFKSIYCNSNFKFLTI
jgi:hypothetical protein